MRRLRRRFRMRRLTGRQVAGGVACGVIIALAIHHGSAASASTGQSAHYSGGGNLSCSALESLWESAGGSASAAFMAAEIARAESGGRQYATDDDGNGSVDRGYWQINSIWGAGSTYDPAGNARAAVQISDDGTNWSPWVTYQTGAYQGQC
jgi:hypothetical protein